MEFLLVWKMKLLGKAAEQSRYIKLPEHRN